VNLTHLRVKLTQKWSGQARLFAGFLMAFRLGVVLASFLPSTEARAMKMQFRILALRAKGLTMVELLVILAIVLLLAAATMPTVISRPERPSQQLSCISNLKQVGLGWLLWVHDHESRDLPFRTPLTNEGTFGSSEPMRNNAWWQFSIISNELNSPKVLVCPADKNVGLPRRVATAWSANDTNGGFLAPSYRHRATSYTIGLDATRPLDPTEWGPPDSILGSDRNILFNGGNGFCSAGLSGTQAIRVSGKNGLRAPAAAPWTNAIHGLRGNIACLDGGVHQTTSKELDALLDLSDDNGSIHFLVPK